VKVSGQLGVEEIKGYLTASCKDLGIKDDTIISIKMCRDVDKLNTAALAVLPLQIITLASPVPGDEVIIGAYETANRAVYVIVIGALVVAPVVEPLSDTVAELLWSPVLAKQVIIPAPLAGTPPVADHVARDHADPLNVAAKTAAWVQVFNLLQTGRKPDFCGKRDRDGTWILVFFDEVVSKTTGGRWPGIGVVLNRANPTAIYNFRRSPSGGIKGSGSDSEWVQHPCPPLEDIFKWAAGA
jgi:hypothetical protein